MKFVTAASMAILLATPALAQQHAPPSEVLAVHDHVAAVSADRIEADIRTLAEFGTRHTLSETESDTRGIGAARRWIFEEFERISAECGGCLEVMYISDTISGTARIPDPVEVVSVVAIQRGRIDPDRYVRRYRQPCDRPSGWHLRQPRRQ
jgi:hypothetical protein